MIGSERNKLVALLSCLAITTATCAHADILIENVSLIDGTGRPTVENASVLIEGDRISRVGIAKIEAPRSTERIDGRGKYLLPGFMDLHIHLQGGTKVDKDGLRKVDIDRKAGILALHSYLYSGVTSVFDAGNNPDYIFALRAEERNGTILGPRIFATGGIVTYPGSHGSFEGATLVDDWPEAIPALDEHIGREPDILKLTLEERGWGARPMIPLLPLDLMEKIVQYYNDHGIRTTVHTAGERRARQAIFAGVDTLAHPIIVGPITEAFAKLMGAKKIPMVTTLTIGENYARLAEHPEYLDQALYQAVLPHDEIERLRGEVREEYAGRSWTWWMKIMTPIAQENVRMIHAAAHPDRLRIVSSDGAIAYEARRRRSEDISCEQFMRELFPECERAPRQDARPTESDKSETSLSDDDTADWLETFGFKEDDDEPFEGFDAMTGR